MCKQIRATPHFSRKRPTGHTRRMRATGWILAFSLLATAFADDMPALNTKIEIDKAAIPARYSAALPSGSADMQRWVKGDARFPPFVHVKDHVLAGDERWIARLGEAANKVPPADQANWARAWSDSTRFDTATNGYCAPVRKIVGGPASALRAALVGQFAATCGTDAELDLITRADTPDAAVIEYYTALKDQFSPDKHPFHPRFASATRALILAGDTDARGAAFNLAEHPDPRGRAELRKIHRELKDRKLADEVALAFYESKDPVERALTAAACKRMPEDPVCTSTVSSADVQQPEPPPDPVELAAAKSWIAKLSAAGFTKVTTVDPAKAAGGGPSVVLTLAGHAWWFDVETDRYPNYHDSLMRNLASLVSPVLDETVFEEVAPPMAEESVPYRLTVYVAGKRLRAEARNLGDWYDVEAVLNLMNAAMKEIHSDIRFIPLPTGDQSLVILGAPESAINRAIQARLIRPGDAGDVERAGKKFEAEALDGLTD